MAQPDEQRTKEKRDGVPFIPFTLVCRTLAYRLTSWKCQGCATALAEVQLVALATVAGQRTLQCQKLKSNYLAYNSNPQDNCGVQRLAWIEIYPAKDRASNGLYRNHYRGRRAKILGSLTLSSCNVSPLLTRAKDRKTTPGSHV
jgi:hypothetical protein